MCLWGNSPAEKHAPVLLNSAEQIQSSSGPPLPSLKRANLPMRVCVRERVSEGVEFLLTDKRVSKTRERARGIRQNVEIINTYESKRRSRERKEERKQRKDTKP